jgi:hypothetical protein
MAYFSNSTDAMNYETQYCSKCVHATGPDGDGCAVMMAHLLYTDFEYDKYKSVLDELIPRSKDRRNEKCLMFYAKEVARSSL